MTTEQKYQELLDVAVKILNAYGMRTPLFNELRRIVDRERPLVQPEQQS